MKARRFNRNDQKIHEAFACVDCSVNTLDINEYYMVHNHLWPIGSDDGMLCIGCLEKRIGRTITSADFTDCLLNNPCYETARSDRLLNRLIGGSPASQGQSVDPSPLVRGHQAKLPFSPSVA